MLILSVLPNLLGLVISVTASPDSHHSLIKIRLIYVEIPRFPYTVKSLITYTYNCIAINITIINRYGNFFCSWPQQSSKKLQAGIIISTLKSGYIRLGYSCKLSSSAWVIPSAARHSRNFLAVSVQILFCSYSMTEFLSPAFTIKSLLSMRSSISSPPLRKHKYTVYDINSLYHIRYIDST